MTTIPSSKTIKDNTEQVLRTIDDKNKSDSDVIHLVRSHISWCKTFLTRKVIRINSAGCTCHSTDMTIALNIIAPALHSSLQDIANTLKGSPRTCAKGIHQELENFLVEVSIE